MPVKSLLKGLIAPLWPAAKRYQSAGFPSSATELAFNLVFALIPLVLLSAVVIGLVVDTQFTLEEVNRTIWLTAPKDIAKPLVAVTKNFIDNSGNIPLLLGIIAAVVWTTTNCGVVIVKGANRLTRGQRPYSLLRLRGKALLMFGSIAVGLVGVFVILGVAYVVMDGLSGVWQQAGLVGMGGFIGYLPVRWLIGLLVAPALFGWIYWAVYQLVSVQASKRCCLRAGLLFYLCWSAIVALFGWYVEHVSAWDAIYGPLSSIFVFLTWCNLTAQLFLFGLVAAGHGELESIDNYR